LISSHSPVIPASEPESSGFIGLSIIIKFQFYLTLVSQGLAGPAPAFSTLKFLSFVSGKNRVGKSRSRRRFAFIFIPENDPNYLLRFLREL